MGRLIDADALLTQVRQIDFLKTPNSTKLSAGEIMNIINKQPTAYDVEKVVAELEKESDFFGGEPMGSLQKAYYCKGVEKAIDIVKAGGVDERA